MEDIVTITLFLTKEQAKEYNKYLEAEKINLTNIERAARARVTSQKGFTNSYTDQCIARQKNLKSLLEIHSSLVKAFGKVLDDSTT